jgi:hypothetical protein
MRGQTTLDFAIGISIFLAVVLFVFIFIPGLLEPFTLSGEEETVLAGTVADRLSQEQLGDPAEPYVLDRHCTVEFFKVSPGATDGCRFDSDPLEDRLNLPPGTNINVTLVGNFSDSPGNSQPLCWDDDGKDISQRGSGVCGNPGDTNLSIGSTPPSSNDATITARRVVSVNGESVTMKVVVW